MFICMPKVKFIIHFLRYYILKNLAILLADSIRAHNWRLSFTRYGVGVEISIKILVFSLDYFQEKLMTKFYKKSKKPYFGAMWPFWNFLPKFGQKWIFVEKSLSQFLNIAIIYHRAKNQKKLICHSWEKYWTDGWMDRQTETEEQTDVCPSVCMSIHPSVQPWFCRTLCKTGVQLLK